MRAESFQRFWPSYLRAHSKRGTRLLHHAGTLLGLGLLGLGLARADWRRLAAAPVAGYALAWTGHLAVEGNRPATFGRPLWSLAADFRMLALALTGRLGAELSRHVPAARGEPQREGDAS